MSPHMNHNLLTICENGIVVVFIYSMSLNIKDRLSEGVH